MVASFREFIEEKYFDEIYKQVNFYIIQNRTSIPFRLNRIDTVKYVRLEDAYFKRFYVHDYSKDKIGITIIVEAQVTLKQYIHGECEYDTDYPWFLVKCSCNFNENITNFKVKSIESYEILDKEQFGLTDNLIPYIKKERLDEYANKILQHIYPEALEGQPIDPYIFAKRLNLTIKEVNFKNENKMGSIFFEEHRTKNAKGEIKITPANTIKVSKKADFLGFHGCKNFTIMHECVHYLLHRRAFQLERLFNKKAKSIECHVDGTGLTDAKTTVIDWMEWQANSLAPRLLMPAEPFKKKVSELFEQYQFQYETNDLLKYYESIMYDLASFYGAPVESVKIRLIELGYEFPLGCFITVDGVPVPPHSFSKGSLASNETFSISEIDAAEYALKQKYIYKNDYIDGYIFVDSHLCINHPKYITVNTNGLLTLTEYATHHMDECCIKFEVDIPTKIGHHEMNYKTFKMLNRKKGNHSEVVVRAYESYQMSAKYNNTKLIEEAFAKVDELFVKIPRTPIGVFKILKEYSGFTNMELEVETGLSKATIDSYLYSEDCKYKKYTVIRLLLAMNIPPKVSLTVLQLCGCVIVPMNKEDQWLEHVLILRWTYKLEENVKFLNDLEIYI